MKHIPRRVLDTCRVLVWGNRRVYLYDKELRRRRTILGFVRFSTMPCDDLTAVTRARSPESHRLLRHASAETPPVLTSRVGQQVQMAFEHRGTKCITCTTIQSSSLNAVT